LAINEDRVQGDDLASNKRQGITDDSANLSRHSKVLQGVKPWCMGEGVRLTQKSSLVLMLEADG